MKQTQLTSFIKKDIKTNNNNIKNDNIMSTMVRKKRVETETKKWESSKLVTSILRELTGEVPGRATANSVVREVINMAWISLEKIWWTSLVEDTWEVISNNRDLQRVIQWRMNNQRQEERMLVNSTNRMERIQRSKEASERSSFYNIYFFSVFLHIINKFCFLSSSLGQFTFTNCNFIYPFAKP